MASRYHEVMKMLRGYGFDGFRPTGRGHYAADHERLSKPVIFASSPSGKHYVNDLEREVRRKLGLSSLGRVATEGERCQKPRKRQVPQQRYGQGEPAQLRTMAEIRAERTYVDLNRMMREHL